MWIRVIQVEALSKLGYEMKQELHEMISVDGLTKRFGSITGVDNISFSVPDGEIFGFLGPNGAGKTTTIRMLTGLLTPDAGEISIGGINLQKRPIAAKMQTTLRTVIDPSRTTTAERRCAGSANL